MNQSASQDTFRQGEIKNRMGAFIRQPREFIPTFGKIVGPYGLAVYMALSYYSDQEGTCFPGVNTIAQQIGCSGQSVRNAMKMLIAINAVSIEYTSLPNGGSTSNTYVLEPFSAMKMPTPPQRGGGGTLNVVEGDPQRGGEGCAQTPLNVVEGDPQRGGGHDLESVEPESDVSNKKKELELEKLCAAPAEAKAEAFPAGGGTDSSSTLPVLFGSTPPTLKVIQPADVIKPAWTPPADPGNANPIKHLFWRIECESNAPIIGPGKYAKVAKELLEHYTEDEIIECYRELKTKTSLAWVDLNGVARAIAQRIAGIRAAKQNPEAPKYGGSAENVAAFYGWKRRQMEAQA